MFSHISEVEVTIKQARSDLVEAQNLAQQLQEQLRLADSEKELMRRQHEEQMAEARLRGEEETLTLENKLAQERIRVRQPWLQHRIRF